ncbi:MAG TPA: hypothetical protein VK597_13365 [Inquilinus sp.]|nr:hypothetical protein [Inquilinus sp.]
MYSFSIKNNTDHLFTSIVLGPGVQGPEFLNKFSKYSVKFQESSATILKTYGPDCVIVIRHASQKLMLIVDLGKNKIRAEVEINIGGCFTIISAEDGTKAIPE